MDAEPAFMICLQCESPCYLFEWNPDKGRLREAFCERCGNEEAQEFSTEEQFLGEED